MKKKTLLLTMLLLVMIMSVALADDRVDVSASTENTYVLSLDLAPYPGSAFSVVWEASGKLKDVLLDSDGDMTAVGDFELWEDGRKSNIIALGYRLGVATPWVGVGKQTIEKTRYEMKTDDGELVKRTTDLTKSETGPAFGVNLEHWMNQIGLTGTLAKVPGGVLITARVKYKYEMGTLHVGYTYNSYLETNKLILGAGLSY